MRRSPVRVRTLAPVNSRVFGFSENPFLMLRTQYVLKDLIRCCHNKNPAFLPGLIFYLWVLLLRQDVDVCGLRLWRLGDLGHADRNLRKSDVDGYAYPDDA